MSQRQIAVAGLVIAAVGLAAGGIAWAQDQHGRMSVVEERTEALHQMQRDIAEMQQDVAAIRERLGINRSGR